MQKAEQLLVSFGASKRQNLESPGGRYRPVHTQDDHKGCVLVDPEERLSAVVSKVYGNDDISLTA